jgi:branched-chain amino acid transport system permease protein
MARPVEPEIVAAPLGRAAPAWPVAVLVVVALVAVSLVASSYQVYVLTLALVYSLASFGMNILTGYSGQLSLGSAAFFGMGAYVVAIAGVKLGWSLPIGVALAIAAGAVAGIIIGLPAARLSELYLGVATLAFLLLFNQVTTLWRPVTGGAVGLSFQNVTLGGVNLQEPRTCSHRPGERRRRAVAGPQSRRLEVRTGLRGAEDERARRERASGVDVTYHKLVASVASAMVTAYAGALYALVVGYVEPNSFDVFLSITFLTMVIVGGRGIRGSIYGAVFVTLLPELMRAVGYSATGRLVLGLGILVVLYFAPHGLAGLSWRKR